MKHFFKIFYFGKKSVEILSSNYIKCIDTKQKQLIMSVVNTVCMNATIDFHHFIAADNACGDSSQTFESMILCAYPMRTFFSLTILVKPMSIEN